jgi:putative FmdB family regulatory protein
LHFPIITGGKWFIKRENLPAEISKDNCFLRQEGGRVLLGGQAPWYASPLRKPSGLDRLANLCYNSKMPLYDFRCPACGKVFEELVSAKQQSLPCPDCQKKAERLLPSSFSARYRGSGFYSTDYQQKKSSQQKS